TEKKLISQGDYLISSGETHFLTKDIMIPDEWKGQVFGLECVIGNPQEPTNHEALVSINGRPYHGIDRNRSFVPLPKTLTGQVMIEIEVFNPVAQSVDQLNYQNEKQEYDPAPLYLLSSSIQVMNQAIEDLLFTVKTYYEAANLLPEGDLTRSF